MLFEVFFIIKIKIINKSFYQKVKRKKSLFFLTNLTKFSLP